MGQPYVSVNYDFHAAEELSLLLAEARRRCDALANLRATQRKSRLGARPGDNWQGARRNRFDEYFAAEQKTLHGLIGEVQSLLRAVDQATEQARGQAHI